MKTTKREGPKGPNKPESIYTPRQEMLMRAYHFAKLSGKQIVAMMDGNVTTSAVGKAVRKGGAYPTFSADKLVEIVEKVGEPRGQLS